MPLPLLENLVRAGQLKSGAASPAEIQGLLRSGLARIKDARRTELDIASRFDLAYNAAHALALAALRLHGYRSENRYIVFQCLVHTISLPNEQWRVLSDAHRKRNIAEYEGDIQLEASQVEAICRVTEEVAVRVSQLASVESA
jgi:hypothetical protein